MFMFLVYILCLCSVTHQANILAISSTSCYSHQSIFWPIWMALAQRGHTLTVITGMPIGEIENIYQIDTSFVEKHIEEAFKAFQSEPDRVKVFDHALEGFVNLEKSIFEYDPVQQLINSTMQYDVVIMQMMFDAMVAFGKKFNAPVIGLLSSDAYSFHHDFFGNPTHPLLYGDILIPTDPNMSIFQKVCMLLQTMRWKSKLQKSFDERSALIKTHFGQDFPNIEELLSNLDMMFINTSPFNSHVRPLSPNVISLGGYLHITAPEPLQEDLQDYLDSAKEGAIYFSLGSNVKSKDLSDQEKKVVIETLADLPYKILWKFEADELPGKPDNVKLIKWAPQQDVLRHPNVKLFITQGGIQSIDEAIFTNVPMVVMPFFGDQHNNAKKIVSKGLALEVDHFNLEKESFKATIMEVITNPKYKETMARLSKLALDQPMTGVEKAVWWTEYVIRHKGAKHLKSHAANVPLYQYLMLDVIGFILLVLGIVIFIIYKITKFILQFVCKLFKSPEKKTGKKVKKN